MVKQAERETVTEQKKQMKKSCKVLLVILCVISALAVLLGALWITTLCMEKKNRQGYTVKQNPVVDTTKTLDRVHFIDVGSGNAILLESNGHYAMFDCGEDTDNHPPKEEVPYGFEDRVIRYLKKYAADVEGKVHLDFVVATHKHSDHIASFDELMDDPDVTVEKCYTKEYKFEEKMAKFEAGWDNQEIYDDLLNGCERNNVELITDLPTEKWQWQDYTLQFFSTEILNKKNMDENCQSIVTKIVKTATGKSLLIVGDSNYMTPLTAGNEWLFRDKVGQCDVYQLGHHGYAMSTFPTTMTRIKPSIAIVCNRKRGKMYPDVRFTTAVLGKAALFVQGEEKGIVLDYTDNGKIDIYGNSCDGLY